ncbi:MAG: phenylalanine--tRNA ligase subunit beta [Bacteroidales bacterium]|nr:phenylalanine--tRNA ligase subunit beta [Bacteroidales bacterium]
MKISYNWLNDYIDIDVDPNKLADILTNIGLEVEGIEQFEEVRGGMKGLIIGEVLTCEKHPNADKLSITTVNTGKGNPLKIVCGAPNVAPKQKVVVATPGTILFVGDKEFTIQKTKIRGAESEGMICAEDEIGIGTVHEGILVLDEKAVPGTSAADYFQIVSDTVFEIGLTPNRIDAASHFGTARDLAAFFSLLGKVNLRKPDISSFASDNNSFHIPIEIKDSEGCRRFTGLTISDLDVKPSPKWLQRKLKSIGLSPINNIVDVTNFVLHELGQPLHAYDANKLNGKKIIVQRLPSGTRFITLDEEERELSDEDIMVCDAKEPVCIAGVFGGLDSGITENTKAIFLESAYFDPVLVRRTARRHDLNTDSSFRFERGVDPENTLYALKRAAILIKELAGGKITSEALDIHSVPVKAVVLDISFEHIDRLIGKSLDKKILRNILQSLDFEIKKEGKEQFTLRVPPYRVDVTREADVIEEILRIYGYNKIEISDKLNASLSYVDQPENEIMVDKVSNFLSANGFHEIMSNSLTKKDYYLDLTTYPEDKLVNILNPLSNELNVMRQTLLFNGLEAIAYNMNHKNQNLRLYEYGRVYSLKSKNTAQFKNFHEVPSFGLFITGDHDEQSWAIPDSSSTFFQLKAFYQNLIQYIGVDPKVFDVKLINNQKDIFSGGLHYFHKNNIVIKAGSIHPDILQQFDIEKEVFFSEINWEYLITLVDRKNRFNEMCRYPEVRRDLALLIDEDISYSSIEKIAFQTENNLLKRVNLFDYYKGKNIPEGKKSYAVSFVLQDQKKTLTDKEIEKIMEKISDNLKKDLHAELR